MYYFKYEGNSAKVYKKSGQWGDLFISEFKYGVDAEEYVKFKNDQNNH